MRRRALLRMAWITLYRDRLGLTLYAIVPILFLTIFASVFQGFGRHGENKVRVALLDLDETAASTMLARAARERALVRERAQRRAARLLDRGRESAAEAAARPRTRDEQLLSAADMWARRRKRADDRVNRRPDARGGGIARRSR